MPSRRAGRAPCRRYRLLLVPSFYAAVVAGQSVSPAVALDFENIVSELHGASERRLSFNCQEGPYNLRSHWSDEQKGYCCGMQNVGCEGNVQFDCVAGLANWMFGWSEEKKSWCCQHKSLGCPAGGKPYDCDAGFWNWQVGWSDPKKQWCCAHEKKGCAGPAQQTNDPFASAAAGDKPYNCQDGLWNFRLGWSKVKKEWCCGNEQVGCEGRPDVVIVESTQQAVAKCGGSEKAFAACHNPECVLTCQPQDCAFGQWSEWSNLGGCYGLCQRERRIVKTNNECGKPCIGSRVMTKGGNQCAPSEGCQQGGDIDCVWEEWSEWSQTCTNVDIDQATR